MSTEELTAALARQQPIDVVAYSGGETRTVKVPTNRKEWSAVIAVLAKLQWDRVELRGRGGDVLAILEHESEPEAPQSIDRDERLLKLLIAGQQAALSYREREAAAALTACVQVMREMTNAVATLSKVHGFQLAAVQTAASSGGEDDDPNALQSSKLLLQMAPMLLGKMMQGAPAPAAPPKNGNAPKNGAGG